jgi:hypothetical protein
LTNMDEAKKHLTCMGGNEMRLNRFTNKMLQTIATNERVDLTQRYAAARELQARDKEKEGKNDTKPNDQKPLWCIIHR